MRAVTVELCKARSSTCKVAANITLLVLVVQLVSPYSTVLSVCFVFSALCSIIPIHTKTIRFVLATGVVD